ncbi:SDR family oxidoreductase [Lactonifactor longoviformis]|uniref:SDR family NAD(P)-dependent oxidoreductase n=1 Tax=Lactonifactor TaxID=420345 RepID=UPI0012B04A89|nr:MULTISPECIES: SDR family oxidoreductase [Lactonifactor]MCB5713397.1 SDR family oxidoreductase [Lactonifactor longoviformis]MCB5716699.1 SDR family oxidoreductase [Lactonifactor longoviformis]MCQ4672318.1 SDR family oxidoreductase [Lactonifactor longoviformis]MSA01455.1 SDR family oxidoreductase [Lactonifactor sp. BIOML-A5]MSA08097.1 SDR family oxidoreductase [Lactonifactor sp. BIOML-A4]
MKPLQIAELRSIYEMLSLKGKAALVTGGAGGIGRSCAAGLAEAGADIVLMDIPQKAQILDENCREIEKRYGVKTGKCMGNVANEADVTRMIQETAELFGRLDVVFSNAGVAGRSDSPSGIPLEEWKRVVDINLTGMFLVNRIAANKMKELGNGGSIINTASMSGHIINKGSRKDMSQHMAVYAATKAGVIQFTKSMAVSYVEDGIRCNSISPGMILSGLHDDMDMAPLEEFVRDAVPMNRFASLNEIMGIVVFLASELSSYATGSDFLIDGGVTIW